MLNKCKEGYLVTTFSHFSSFSEMRSHVLNQENYGLQIYLPTHYLKFYGEKKSLRMLNLVWYMSKKNSPHLSKLLPYRPSVSDL